VDFTPPHRARLTSSVETFISAKIELTKLFLYMKSFFKSGIVSRSYECLGILVLNK
jgi:hypothetical protein